VSEGPPSRLEQYLTFLLSCIYIFLIFGGTVRRHSKSLAMTRRQTGKYLLKKYLCMKFEDPTGREGSIVDLIAGNGS